MLLILSSDADLTADYLIVELLARELEYFRLNSEQIAAGDFEFLLSGDGYNQRIRLGPKTLDLADVTAIWYRRAIQPRPIGDSAGQRAFVSGELRHLVTGLVWKPDIRWVNPIDKVTMGELKLFQLKVAKALGFRVPRTLVSRNATQVRAFMRGNSETICKPIFHGLFVDGPSQYAVYTRRVTLDSIDTAALSVCPALFQEEIPRRADVRATFIGDDCFTAEIVAENPIVDWRDPDVSVQFTPATLPRDVENACRAMMRELGLRFGAFDFIRTPEGEFVFLEVNPTGEWAWLEESLGFPMRGSFIKLFFERDR